MKKIAILTSGGDASTMNKALSSLVYFADKKKFKTYFVRKGYKGLYHDDFIEADLNDTRDWENMPGTQIYTSRFPEFKDAEIRKQASFNLQKRGIDCLIVVGGDGSYNGLAKLSEEGVGVIGLPGTIDNDVSSSSYTIGFDSALNNVVQRINNIKASMDSHSNIAMIEIMGRKCVDLTVFAAMATEADIVITSESYLNPKKVLDRIFEIRKKRPFGGILILVTEKFLGYNKRPKLEEYKKYVEENSDELLKINVLGFVQRGSVPTAMDKIRATMMAQRAISLVSRRNYGRIVGVDEFNVVDYSIPRALRMTTPKRAVLLKKYI